MSGLLFVIDQLGAEVAALREQLRQAEQRALVAEAQVAALIEPDADTPPVS